MVIIGWSRLELGAASDAAQHVVTHTRPWPNPILSILIFCLIRSQKASSYNLSFL